jgi:transposase InsO family protein
VAHDLLLASFCKGQSVYKSRGYSLQASGCYDVRVLHKPRLLSDNGSSYISAELADWLGDHEPQLVGTCYVETILDGVERPVLTPTYFRIRIETITGHRGLADSPVRQAQPAGISGLTNVP